MFPVPGFPPHERCGAPVALVGRSSPGECVVSRPGAPPERGWLLDGQRQTASFSGKWLRLKSKVTFMLIINMSSLQSSWNFVVCLPLLSQMYSNNLS